MTGGFVAPGFEPVRDAFEAGLAEELGAGFAAVRDGEIVVNLWGGWADRAHTRAWAHDTIVPIYSSTKGVAGDGDGLARGSRLALIMRRRPRACGRRLRRARQG